jgi:uncharacterized membrane protein
MKPNAKKMIWMAPLAIIGMIVFVTIGGTIVMLLWNWLVPGLFRLPLISFWQALGILVLCRILFGGFGMSGSRGSHSRSRQTGDRIADRVAERLDERWETMTPEERERMRERWRGPKGETQPL